MTWTLQPAPRVLAASGPRLHHAGRRRQPRAAGVASDTPPHSPFLPRPGPNPPSHHRGDKRKNYFASRPDWVTLGKAVPRGEWVPEPEEAHRQVGRTPGFDRPPTQRGCEPHPWSIRSAARTGLSGTALASTGADSPTCGGNHTTDGCRTPTICWSNPSQRDRVMADDGLSAIRSSCPSPHRPPSSLAAVCTEPSATSGAGASWPSFPSPWCPGASSS